MNNNNTYNDQQIANTLASHSMNSAYQLDNENKSHDLLELYEALRKQREYMYTNNTDHSLDSIIESTDNHISILSTMLNKKSVKSHQAEPNTPQPHLRPYIPNNIYNNEYNNNINNGSNSTHPIPPNTNNGDNNNSQPNGSGRPNTNNNVPNLNNNISPQPRPNNNIGLPNTNNNVPNTNNDNTPPTNEAEITPRNIRNRTRINSRSSPLQSRIASIARAIMGRFKPINQIYDDQERNRFHNIVVESASCQPHNKLITNECNILRLLLLYITLHPHCRHCSTLSTIANDRLGILMQLL